MTNYANAFENTDLRLIGLRGGPFGYRDPGTQQRGCRTSLYIKETSGMPLQPLQSSTKDPVYNIAIQNPIAQPGGGKCQFQSHRYDLGDLYGAQTNADLVPDIPIVSDKRFSPAAFSSYETESPQKIQQQYYAAGKRIDGTVLYVANSTQSYEHTALNREDSSFKREKRYARHDEQNRMSQKNVVSYTGTALLCDSPSVGSRKRIGDYYTGYTADSSIPPKTVVSSTDTTLFKTE